MDNRFADFNKNLDSNLVSILDSVGGLKKEFSKSVSYNLTSSQEIPIWFSSVYTNLSIGDSVFVKVFCYSGSDVLYFDFSCKGVQNPLNCCFRIEGLFWSEGVVCKYNSSAVMDFKDCNPYFGGFLGRTSEESFYYNSEVRWYMNNFNVLCLKVTRVA